MVYRITGMCKQLVMNRWMYAMMAPGILFFVVFKYVPMWGVVISFQDYQPFLGISGSEWVGLKHFERLFSSPDFWLLFKNTLMLFVWDMTFAFSIPILLALMLNELRSLLFKRAVQTLIYIPHFMSWVIVVSLTYIMLTTEGGIVNELLVKWGGTPVNFMLSQGWFRPVYTIQTIWKEAGWGTIIYLAALAGVDQQLYEAARMDGASRWQQMWHVTLPGIRSTIVVLLILKVGDMLDLSFDHVFLMVNSMNREVADVFDTFVYLTGISQGQFSYSTAIGLFKSAVGLVMVVAANRLAKMLGEEGIY
ncbi:ABC transporter permease [Paenibacillus sp. FSL H8-0034]|uniref:ABC transporter permease n=1 Tax=Paenibacillus sp. FSL H8-0034 TaxID=2954671 RepID=UPI0030FA2F8C